MAEEVTLGGDGDLFIGEDKTLTLEVLDNGGLPLNIAAWTIVFDVRLHDDTTTSLLAKVANITGTYDAARATNTQRAVVTLTDTETGTLPARQNKFSWKRTNDGSETILAYGKLTVQRTTQI